MILGHKFISIFDDFLDRPTITNRPQKGKLVPPAGIEPASQAPEARILSVELRGGERLHFDLKALFMQ